MAKKMEEMSIDLDNENLELVELPIKQELSNKEKAKQSVSNKEEVTINCLRNERITVRYIPKTHGIWGNNPRHVLSGGMSEGSSRTFVVPRLASGMYVNVLTDSEKSFLEEFMGLEYNALSVYKKQDNFWDDSNEDGINSVRLTKQDNYFDLSDPEQYIKYKILLANKDDIAPSLQALLDMPKATYQYVIISDGEETKNAKKHMSNTMQCYKEFGKVEDNFNILRLIVETIDSRPISKDTKIEFLQTRVNELIQNDSKMFLKVITDPYINTKVLIKKAIEAGLISNRGGMLYLRSDNSPLCEHNEEPTLNIAAKYLNMPSHSAIKMSLEAQIKD